MSAEVKETCLPLAQVQHPILANILALVFLITMEITYSYLELVIALALSFRAESTSGVCVSYRPFASSGLA